MESMDTNTSNNTATVTVPMSVDTPLPTTTTTTNTTTLNSDPVVTESIVVQEPSFDISKLTPSDIKDTSQLSKVVDMLMQQRQQDMERIKQIEKDAEIGRQALAQRAEQEALEKTNQRNAFENMLNDVIKQRNMLNNVLKTDSSKDPILEKMKELQSEFTTNPDTFMTLQNEVRTAHAATAQQLVFLENKEKEMQELKQQLDKVNNEKEQIKNEKEKIVNTINEVSVLKKIEHFLKPQTNFGQFQSNTDNQMKSNNSLSSSSSQKSLIPTFDMSQFPTLNQKMQEPSQTMVPENMIQQTTHAASASTSALSEQPSTSSSNNNTTPASSSSNYQKTMAEVYANNTFMDILAARFSKNSDYVERSAFAASNNALKSTQSYCPQNQYVEQSSLTSCKQLNMSLPEHQLLGSKTLPMLFQQVPGANEWDPNAFNEVVYMGRRLGIGMTEPSELVSQVNNYHQRKRYEQFGFNQPPVLGNLRTTPGTHIVAFNQERDIINNTMSSYGVPIY